VGEKGYMTDRLNCALSLVALTVLLPFSAAAQVLTEFPTPTSAASPFAITVGPDGAMWFSEASANKIGRVTTAGSITEFGGLTGTFPDGIVTGPDNNLWFVEFTGAQKVGRMTTTGTLTEFPLGGNPQGIAAGPDGNLWIPQNTGNVIVRMNTSGVITGTFPLVLGSAPRHITAGPDGNLWFAESANPARIGRITTAGVLTEFAIPTPTGSPFGITSGPDGNLWFTEANVPKIGRITTAGVITEFPVNGQPLLIAPGPDGALWFGEGNGNKIGRITTSGAYTEYTPPTASSSPTGVVTGPDRNLWITESGPSLIGRLTGQSKIGIFNATQSVFLLDANGNFSWDGSATDPFFPWGTANHNPKYIVVTGDWNGSGSKKIGIFDPATAIWLLDYNGDGVYTPGVDKYFAWGSPGDTPVVGDWNGSGTTKIGTFGPTTGLWLLDYNGNYNWDGPSVDKYFPWGSPGDTPVVGDWNASGTTKVGTFGPQTGLWLLDYNGNFAWDGPAVDKYFPWGSAGDTPFVGNWNGSGTAKIGTFGPKTGLWLLDYNGNFSWDGPGVDKYFPWGSGGDTPAVGDWNGSGTTKVGTFGPGTGLWLLDYNGNFNWDGASVDKYFSWGSPGDTPVILK
jgi:virginiamycin B lyase